MKVEARISETGALVRADNDEDWALVHPPHEPRPALHCRDCSTALHAKERRHQGGVTRFFAFNPRGRSCRHREVASGHTVGATVETNEHHWLKNYVAEQARELGYQAVVEAALAPGVRADVFVTGASRGRVEIQRGATHVPSRGAAYPDCVWLLRMAFDDANKKYLFDFPCVQVRIVAQDDHKAWRAAETWRGDATGVQVRATSTVLAARRRPPASWDEPFFENAKNVPLRVFLERVWSGDRIWVERGVVHRFAGWVLKIDLERFEAWRVSCDGPGAGTGDRSARGRAGWSPWPPPATPRLPPPPPPPPPPFRPNRRSMSPQPSARWIRRLRRR